MDNTKFIILILCIFLAIFLHMIGIIRFTTGCFPWQACKPAVYQFEFEQEEI